MYGARVAQGKSAVGGEDQVMRHMRKTHVKQKNKKTLTRGMTRRSFDVKTLDEQQELLDDSKIVTFDCRGQKHQIRSSALLRYPNTLLCRMHLQPHKYQFRPKTKEGHFTFDRDPRAFIEILNMFRTQEDSMEAPLGMPLEAWLRAALFFGFESNDILPQPVPDSLKPDSPKWKVDLFVFLDDPMCSAKALAFACLSLACTIISIICICVETLYNHEITYQGGTVPNITALNASNLANGTNHTLPNVTRQLQLCLDSFQSLYEVGVDCGGYCEPCEIPVYGNPPEIFRVIEGVCVAIFTIEYIMGFIATSNKCSWLTSSSLLDLLSFIPFYFIIATGSIMTSSFAVLRVIRLGRVFRVFKMGGQRQGFKAITNTLKESAQELSLLLFFLLMADLLFASLMYFFEHGRPGEGLDGARVFSDVPTCMYWGIVTMTSLGYGDFAPTTEGGIVVAALASVIGVITIALPMVVIGQNFKENFHLMFKLKAMETVKAELAREAREAEQAAEEQDKIMHRQNVLQKMVGVKQSAGGLFRRATKGKGNKKAPRSMLANLRQSNRVVPSAALTEESKLE